MASARSGMVRRRLRSRTEGSRTAALVIVGLALVAGVAGLVILLSLVAPPPPEPLSVPGRLVAGDLVLELQGSGWITHDDIGGPAPASVQDGFQMPASMMPGMPGAGTHRLYLEAVLSDKAPGSRVDFSPKEFAVRAPSGGTWPLNQPATFQAGALRSGQTRSLDLLFDVPDTVAQLDLVWTHAGQVQSTPVGAPPPPVHAHGG